MSEPDYGTMPQKPKLIGRARVDLTRHMRVAVRKCKLCVRLMWLRAQTLKWLCLASRLWNSAPNQRQWLLIASLALILLAIYLFIGFALRSGTTEQLVAQQAGNLSNAEFRKVLKRWDYTVLEHGGYVILLNYVPALMKFSNYESVTLTTQSTFEYINNLEPLARRWRGPIAISIYAPGTDFLSTVKVISRLRHCVKEIRDYVTFHLYFEAEFGPGGKFMNLSSGTVLLEQHTVDCEKLRVTGLYADIDVASFRKERGLTYPINVARNIARLSAHTYFVLASDVELWPSSNVIAMFLRLVRKQERFISNRRVFVLPIFEVHERRQAPLTKAELLPLFAKGELVYFHRFVCIHCQLMPRLGRWLNQRPVNGSMSVLYQVKRHYPLNRWEPIYIGTNADPLYEEELSWEGQQDKMSQMHELCLLDYDLAVLDNAFLVHAPGIKYRSDSFYESNRAYARHNDLVHKRKITELDDRYGRNPKCHH